MFIDTENKDYKANKDNPDSIPIAIQLKEDYGKKAPTMYLHRMDWIKPSNVAEGTLEQVKEQTKALREFLFKSGQPTLNYTISKSPGFINRSKKERTVSEIIGNDTRPLIAFGTRNNTLDVESVDVFNEDFVAGIPYLVLPTADGSYFATWLRQREIKTQPELQKKYNDTVIALIEAYENDTIKELSTLKILREEISKYYNVGAMRIKPDETINWSNDRKNAIFTIYDDIDGNLQIQLPAPDRKGVGFRNYQYKDGKWQGQFPTKLPDGTTQVTWKDVDIQKILREKLGDKFPNITKEGVKAGKDFEVYELVDGKLIKNNIDHTKFISDNKVVTSRVQPFVVNGINTYFSQASIGLNTNTSKLKTYSVAKKKAPKSFELSEKSSNFAELTSEPITDILSEFSEAEVKEGEKIMKHCKGQ